MKLFLKTNIIALIVLPLLTLGCSGESSEFPEGCVDKGITYNENNVVLNDNSSGQLLYLFHNTSDKDFWLNHPVTKDPGASAGWASSLSSGNWSALTMGGPSSSFDITCSTMDESGKVDYLNCKDVVKTCMVLNTKFKSGDGGSYWVAEDKNLQEIEAEIKSRGIDW